MIRRTFLTLCLLGSVSLAQASPPRFKPFMPLFNQKNMDGWKNPYDWGTIEVVGDEIHLTGDKKFFVTTERKFANFVFEGEVHLPEGKANSGFMFRAHVEPNKVYGYQAEVDGDPNRGWSGGLYDEGRRLWFISPRNLKAAKDATPEQIAENDRLNKESIAAFRERAGNAFKRNGWNTYRITCIDDSIKIEVNGVTTTDIKDAKDASGHIAIQHHGEKGATYRFRNLRIQELP